MSEMLFRGQQRRNGEMCRLDGSPLESLWVYGNGILQCKGQSSIIYQTEPVFDKYSVYSDTLGLFTGKELGGDKIFTGDIIKTYEDYDDAFGYSTCGTFNSVVIWDKKDFCFALKVDEYVHPQPFNDWDWEHSKKVGNIYDNPELLNEVYE